MIYVTKQGDTWDQVAHEQLGDVRFRNDLMRANHEYHDVFIFSAGTELVIPEISQRTDSSSLPPWKRVSG